MRRMLLIAAAACLAGTAVLRAEEWPKWMGVHGDNISTDAIAPSWPASGPREVWKQPVGLGYSSPLALEGKIYLFNQVGRDDTLTVFDAGSGKILWKQTYAGTIPAEATQSKNPENGLPLVLATPTIDAERIYTYGGGGDLFCRKLDGGAPIWHLNVLSELNETILQWAQASSPLVTDKLVYVQGGKGGSTCAAFDKLTGKLIWQSQAKSSGGYAAQIIVDVKGTPELITFGNTSLYGMNPENGKTLWEFPWKNQAQVNAMTPKYRDGYLFIATDYNQGGMMVQLTPDGKAEKLWANKNIMQKFQPGILEGDYYYANSEGTMKCMHWPDGKIQWEANVPALRLGPGGSVERAGDKLIVMSEHGKLSLLQAGPKGYKLISQKQMFDFGQVWSSPLIYRGKLYTMGKDSLVCLDIGSNTADAGL
jgi:outer membrane protein assembly factor BamB